MRAVTVIPLKRNSLEILEYKIPKNKSNEILVKVLQVGIDGTDKEIIEGLYGECPKGENKLVIGHESLGIIESVGNSVTDFRKGDLVVAMVRRPDDCINCKNSQQDMCLKGNYKESGIKGLNGYLTEYYVEDSKYLVKVPKKLFSTAVLLEPFSVAEKAIRQAFKSQKRMIWKPKTALVTGSGTLGLICALILKSRGLKVAIYDRGNDKYKEKLFSTAKITHFTSDKIELHDIPKKFGEVDMIFEMTGNSSVAMHSMMIGSTNSVIVLTSITGGDNSINLCSDCFNQGMVLNNKLVVGSVNANIIDFRRGVLDMKKINNLFPNLLEKLITSRFKLDEISKAISKLSENIKIVIDVSKK